MVQLELLRVLGHHRDDGEGVELLPPSEGGSRGVERSLQKLHALKAELHRQPRALVNDHISRVKEGMGFCEGQVWCFSDHNKRIQWGRHKTSTS